MIIIVVIIALFFYIAIKSNITATSTPYSLTTEQSSVILNISLKLYQAMECVQSSLSSNRDTLLNYSVWL